MCLKLGKQGLCAGSSLCVVAPLTVLSVGRLNLVVSIYSGQPLLVPHIEEFLGVNAGTRGSMASNYAAADISSVSVDGILGMWHARGLNQYRENTIENESFMFEKTAAGVVRERNMHVYCVYR